MSNSIAPVLRPITDADLDEVDRFLHLHFPPDSPRGEWAARWRGAVNLPGSEAPNHGYLLGGEAGIVGVYLAVYSRRLIEGRSERFCSLAAWCVLPGQRQHSVRLLRAILAQQGWHFTDLAPSETAQRLNARLGFGYLDTEAGVFPHIVLTAGPRRTRVTDDPARIADLLAGETLRYYRDHAKSRWAHHLVIESAGRSCYVQWRPTALKGVKVFANVHYISDPAVFAAAFPAFARWMVLRRHMLATIVERRVAGELRRPHAHTRPRGRMYRSATLGPEAIDYLYSEMTIVP